MSNVGGTSNQGCRTIKAYIANGKMWKYLFITLVN